MASLAALLKKGADAPKPFESVEGLGDNTRFMELVEEKQELDAWVRKAEAFKKSGKADELLTLMMAADAEKVLYDGDTVKIGHGATAATIDPRLLLQAGVLLETIQACTVPGRTTTFIQIVPAK